MSLNEINEALQANWQNHFEDSSEYRSKELSKILTEFFQRESDQLIEDIRKADGLFDRQYEINEMNGTDPKKYSSLIKAKAICSLSLPFHASVGYDCLKRKWFVRVKRGDNLFE